MDRYFVNWLDSINTSFIITSYKTGDIYSLGTTYNSEIKDVIPSLWITSFQRPMGLAKSKNKIWLSSAGHLWCCSNEGSHKSDNKIYKDFDANYCPRQVYTINDINIHDMVVDKNDKIVFCSSLFSCLGTLSETKSFKVYWKPPWISKIAAEDRCHLNGVCLDENNEIRYVTAVSKTDVSQAWRENRIGGGFIYDIIENKVVCKDLNMPHSPRWHNNKLWVLDSGSGYFGHVEDGKFIKDCFIQGFARGLCFVENRYAIVTSSDDRHDKAFSDLPVGDKLREQGIKPKCGIYVIDLKSMDVIHYMEFDEPIVEIYDIMALPNVKRPRIETMFDSEMFLKFSFEE